MYLIREVVNCKPGRVHRMVEKFRAISEVLSSMGIAPLRLLTDVSGEQFWTVVAEAEVEQIRDFFEFEQKAMVNEKLRETMANYHELVASGRREIYRIEESS